MILAMRTSTWGRMGILSSFSGILYVETHGFPKKVVSKKGQLQHDKLATYTIKQHLHVQAMHRSVPCDH